MKKIIMLSLVVLLLSITVLGCGSNNSANNQNGQKKETEQGQDKQDNKEPKKSDKPVEKKEVTVFHFKVNIEKQFQELIDIYNAEHPNVVVKQEAVGGSTDWMALLKTRFAAGNGPEIFVVDGVSQLNLWKDRLADLSNEPWVDQSFAFAKSSMTIDDKLYAMPVNIEGYGFIYNKDIFNELNIEVPATLTDLKAAAKKIKEAGYTPFASGFGEWWVIGMHLLNVPFAHQPDADAFVDQLNEGSATIPGNETFAKFKDLMDTIVEYGDPNPLTNDFNAQVALFAGGEAAMIQQGNWMEPTVFETNPDMNMGLMPIPLSDEPKMDKLPVGVPQNFVVNKETDSVDEAKAFLNWLVTDETALKYYTDEFGYIPAFDHISADNLGPLSQDIAKYSKADKTIPWAFNKWPDGSYNKFASILQGYVGKQSDYEETLVKLQQAWDELK
jgi:raffinose/stachyose/melibiose transport system substrate-binding protein